jgi:hypothetical protein
MGAEIQAAIPPIPFLFAFQKQFISTKKNSTKRKREYPCVQSTFVLA